LFLLCQTRVQETSHPREVKFSTIK
jgi:hypothetical protein